MTLVVCSLHAFWMLSFASNHPRTFYWSSTLDRRIPLFLSRNWNNGEPNNYGGHEACTFVMARDHKSYSAGRWYDVGCNLVRAALCESTSKWLRSHAVSWLTERDIGRVLTKFEDVKEPYYYSLPMRNSKIWLFRNKANRASLQISPQTFATSF